MKKATFLGVFNPNVSKGIDANLLNDFKRGLNAVKKDFCDSRKAFLSIQRIIMSEAIRRVRKTRRALGGCREYLYSRPQQGLGSCEELRWS